VERYGYRDPEQELELVTIRVSATTAGADIELAGAWESEPAERQSRQATLGGEGVELEVLRGALASGASISGPAIVELPESTVLVPGHWSGTVDDAGTIRLERAR
jgi:N-methylhydantoinase A